MSGEQATLLLLCRDLADHTATLCPHLTALVDEIMKKTRNFVHNAGMHVTQVEALGLILKCDQVAQEFVRRPPHTHTQIIKYVRKLAQKAIFQDLFKMAWFDFKYFMIS